VYRIKPFSHIGTGFFKNRARERREGIFTRMTDTNFLSCHPIQVDLRPAMRAGQFIVVSDPIKIVYGSFLRGKPLIKLIKRHKQSPFYLVIANKF
jgi:hypothetical protein